MEKIKILGIVGAGRKNGNTFKLVNEALNGAKEVENVETKLLHLIDKKIEPCRGYGCDVCRTKKVPCIIKDDFEKVAEEVFQADGIIIGTPVYMGTIAAHLKGFLERFRSYNVLSLFFKKEQKLRNKVGGAIAVGIDHYGGQEYAIADIINFFLVHEMVVVSGRPPYGYFGGCAESVEIKEDGSFTCPPDGVKHDEIGLKSCKALGRRVAEIARIIKRSGII